MANYERDKDDVRVFDGGEDDEAEGSHLPVVIIIAILVLAAFGGVVWLAYNQGVARGRNEIPVQVASNEPGKGGQIKVYQQAAGADDEENVQTAPASPDTAEPKPLAAPKPEAMQSAPPPETRVAQVTSAPATTTPPPAALAPAKPMAQAPVAKPAPAPAVVATKPPAQLGLAHPAVQTPPAQATAAPVKPAAVTPKPVAVVAPKPVATAAVAPAGSYLLQLGAYKSQEEAMSAWKIYQGKHATLLRGFSPDVQRADLGSKGVWYRLRAGSFADKNAAAALCDRLKADNGACFLAR
jgi:cell division septation protein DedD